MAEGAQENSGEESDVDIAIIGAGPAGLYTAWRLLQDDQYKNQKIRVFDAAERIGGRVLSVQLPKIPFIAELGAMRFIPAQLLISNLVEHLGLVTAAFNFDVRGYKLRGELFADDLFTGKEPAEGTAEKISVPYRLDDSEKGKGPGKLIELAILRALRDDLDLTDVRDKDGANINDLREKLDSLDEKNPPEDPVNYFTPQEWGFIKKYGRIGDHYLWQIGFWDLIQQHLSDDAYNLANDGSGYQSILSMWNAADAILWYLADFACSDYQTIAGGMVQIVDRLARDSVVLAQSKDLVSLGCELQKITALTADGQSTFKLEFETGRYVTKARETGTRAVTAKKVILALPQPALKKLKLEGLTFRGKPGEDATPYFHGLLNEVTANPLFKAFAFFKDAWWPHETDNRCFRVYTDLQLRQIYHLGVDRQCSTISTIHDRKKMCAVLLYSDARYADYWGYLNNWSADKDPQTDDIENKRVYLSEFRNLLDKADREKFDLILQSYGTNDLLEYRVRDFLGRVNGLKTKGVPRPITIILKNWADPPNYAGWHSWNMGARSWVTSERLVCPFEGDIFTCGEAFSSEQGWIEGALKSSERVLERLGLPDPSWIRDRDKDGYQKAKAIWVLKATTQNKA